MERRSSGEIVRLAQYQVDRPTVDYPPDVIEPETTTSPTMPTKIGRYTVLDVLGVGGMGVVCTAWDPKLDRKVALKLLRRRKNDSDGRLSTGRARLVREAKSLAKLSHPNIITVLDVDLYEGQIYMAMEYVDGASLDQWVIRGERSWREVIAVFIDAARGLAAAHAAGIIHRDFKPANVLIGKDGRVHVVDFGLAKSRDQDDKFDEGDAEPEATIDPTEMREQGGLFDVLRSTQDAKLTQVGRTVGTPAYMAPEQFLGMPVGSQTDQFSFGVALFEALYGYLPFPDDSRDELIDRVTEGKVNDPPRDTVVPGWVHRIVLRTLQPRPEHRFESVDDLIEALQADPARRRRRIAFAAGGAMLLGIGAYGVVQGFSSDVELCKGADSHMEAIWGEDRKAEVKQAFGAIDRPYAADAWIRVEDELDARANAWAQLHTDVCRATSVHGEQSAELMDVRMACLDRRRGEMGAVVEVFATADARVVESAVNAVQSLDSLDPCRTLTIGQGQGLEDPARRELADEIEALLAQAKAMGAAGKPEPALEHAKNALRMARDLDHRPLLARAAVVHARAQWEQVTDDVAGVRTFMVEAIELAAATEQPTLEAKAWSMLIILEGQRMRHFDAALALELPARIAASRAAEPRVEAALDSAVGTVLSKSGRHEEALTAMVRALKGYEGALGQHHAKVAAVQSNLGIEYAQLRLLPDARHYLNEAAKTVERVYGSHHPWLGSIRINLGGLAKMDGDTETANKEYQRAVEILSRSLPHGHRRTLNAMIGLAQTESKEDPQRAEKRYRDVLAIVKAQRDPDLLTIVNTYNSLGWLQRSRAKTAESEKKPERAAKHQLEAYKSLRAALDAAEAAGSGALPDEQLATVHSNLCELERERRRAQTAIEHCKATWDLSASDDQVDKEAVEALRELAQQYLELERPDDAIQALQAALKPTPMALSVPLRITLADLLWNDTSTRAEAVQIVRDARQALLTEPDSDELSDLERWLRQH
ncbi:MAG: serine/threonine-protein kinase [Myxococcota bacterium]